jgi:hypothetical protein
VTINQRSTTAQLREQNVKRDQNRTEHRANAIPIQEMQINGSYKIEDMRRSRTSDDQQPLDLRALIGV